MTDKQPNSRPTKIPSRSRHAHSFQILFLEFCFSTPAFSSTILFHKFIQVFDTLKIQCIALETETLWWNGLFAWAFLLFLWHFTGKFTFHMNLNIQNSWPLWSSTYRWQFSTGNIFHGKVCTNPGVTSMILRAAVISLRLLCALLCRLHLPDSFVKPPPWFSMWYSGRANSWGPFVLNVHSVCRCWSWPHGQSSIMPSCAVCSWLQPPDYFAKPPPRISVCYSSKATRSGPCVF